LDEGWLRKSSDCWIWAVALADLLRRGFFCGVPNGVDEADEE